MCAVGRASQDAVTVTYGLQHCGGTLVAPQVVITGGQQAGARSAMCAPHTCCLVL